MLDVLESKTSRSSFLNKNQDKFDCVEKDGMKFIIPARIGSCYWAILKVMYTYSNKKVYFTQLIDKVNEEMKDRDEKYWENISNKKTVNPYKKNIRQSAGKQIAKRWEQRVINNTKTLTRLGGATPYGQRIYERGHVLKLEYDQEKNPYFILHTEIKK